MKILFSCGIVAAAGWSIPKFIQILNTDVKTKKCLFIRRLCVIVHFANKYIAGQSTANCTGDFY